MQTGISCRDKEERSGGNDTTLPLKTQVLQFFFTLNIPVLSHFDIFVACSITSWWNFPLKPTASLHPSMGCPVWQPSLFPVVSICDWKQCPEQLYCKMTSFMTCNFTCLRKIGCAFVSCFDLMLIDTYNDAPVRKRTMLMDLVEIAEYISLFLHELFCFCHHCRVYFFSSQAAKTCSEVLI